MAEDFWKIYAEYLKTLIRPLGNAGLQAGAMKAITMDHLSVSANMDMVVEVLQKFGPTNSYRNIARQTESKSQKGCGMEISKVGRVRPHAEVP